MGEFLPYQRGKSLLLLDYYLPVAVGVLGLGEYLMTFEPYGAWHVLYGFAVVEPYLEYLAALHGGKFQLGLDEVHGAEHTAEVLFNANGNANISTDPTPEARTDEYYKKRPCVKMVELAIRTYMRFLEEHDTED